MAGIDKLFLNSYEELSELRTWAIIYYPKMLACFNNNWMMPADDYQYHYKKWLKKQKSDVKKEFEKHLGGALDIEQATQNIIKHYKEALKFCCPYQLARTEAKSIIEQYSWDDVDWLIHYSFPIMQASYKIDRRLKWICPLPYVRKYLHEQCGVNPKLEWLYKIFWKGKKEFDY